ncbi:hypothetical protein KY358_06565 [Candidatus Woesearchaeota archaeon]|nr:hypothetical protein [Candidatus Woesearchaeota archaeon]
MYDDYPLGGLCGGTQVIFQKLKGRTFYSAIVVEGDRSKGKHVRGTDKRIKGQVFYPYQISTNIFYVTPDFLDGLLDNEGITELLWEQCDVGCGGIPRKKVCKKYIIISKNYIAPTDI